MSRPERQPAPAGTAPRGHVFAVQGRMELLRHDAAVVPTGPAFSVSPAWRPLIGTDPAVLRPPDWGRPGVRHARAGEALWFLDVERRDDAVLSWLLDGVRGVLGEIAATIAPEAGRVLPLVVVPVVGIGAGGFGDDRGAVIRGLLDVADDVVRRHAVDLAFVTPDPAVHGAVQHLRRLRHGWPLDPELLEAAAGLAEQARRGELALFFGAGVSIPAGLPSWADLLRACLEAAPDLDTEEFARLHPLDQGELLRRVLGDRFGSVVAELADADRHALGHSLLAALRCREAATTNYDHCYELAAAPHVEPVVMPWRTPRGAEPWLLKLNGDVDHPESIVLARRDFLRHQALARPAAAVLEAMMLTRHLLIVGASLTDDNVLRLTHEVSEFRAEHGGKDQPFGTVLDVETDGVRRQLWAGELEWLPMPGPDLAHRARALDLFLDAVAAEATTDASWVLDERFESLLEGGDAETARRARSLWTDLGDREPWVALRAELERHGSG
ncbi:SIR2 family protein [Pseudonocardia yuanmonensis]|uniref:SIR2 family protein n=1 Tax=Pseudonocardia yuanmonensis TaxID=1095914 RepID=A0ABP8W1X9_9PSEU